MRNKDAIAFEKEDEMILEATFSSFVFDKRSRLSSKERKKKKRRERESLISSPVRTSRNNYSGWLFAHSSLLRPMVYISDEVRICHKYTERSSISLSPWSTPRAHAVGDTYGCLPPPPPPPILPELLLLLLLGPIPRRGRKPRSRIARNPSSYIVFGSVQTCPRIPSCLTLDPRGGELRLRKLN